MKVYMNWMNVVRSENYAKNQVKKDAGIFWRAFQICLHSNSQSPQIVLSREFDFTKHTLLHQYEVLSVSFSNHSCHRRNILLHLSWHPRQTLYVLQGGGMSILNNSRICLWSRLITFCTLSNFFTSQD